MIDRSSLCLLVSDIRSWPESKELLGYDLHIGERVPDMSTVSVDPLQYERVGATYKGKPLYLRVRFDPLVREGA